MSLLFGMRFMYLGCSHETLCRCVIASITKYTHTCVYQSIWVEPFA